MDVLWHGDGYPQKGHDEEDDVLDLRLLNQISKWIMYSRLPSLARHLGISDAEISRIMIPHTTPEEQCFQVQNF